MNKPVAIVQHTVHEHPALMKRALDAQFIPNTMVNAFEDVHYPKPHEISGLISLGGPMSANDEGDHPWILEETYLMKKCVEVGTPILGICLGGQMLARSLGGKVTQNAHPEIGWYPIEKTPDGEKDRYFSQLGPSPAFYQWHYDTFHLPAGARLLARSSICERQAFAIGENAYGVQFHPEVDHPLIQEWLSIEGTDEEILLARMAHPHDCVQEPREHLKKATEAQMESVLLVTMMTDLFNPLKFSCSTDAALAFVESSSHESWIVELKDLVSEKKFKLLGKIFQRRQLSEGNFVFFREPNGLLWPIREDYITSVERFEHP